MSLASSLPTIPPTAPTQLGYIRARFQRWFQSRLPLTDTTVLTQRNVYILPTPAGWMMLATLLVLLLASINYQLNLGYLLTFLIGGSVLVGMHMGHATLRGITMNLVTPTASFTPSSASFDVILSNPGKKPRHSIGLSVLNMAHWTWADVAAQGHTTLRVTGLPLPRGKHALPVLTAETRFPLGVFRVWTVWRPAAHVWVYPAMEKPAPPLPPGAPRPGEARLSPLQATGEYDGVRAYRRGDPLKLVIWKKAAKTWAHADPDEQRQTNNLLSRDMQHTQAHELWLDFSRTGCHGVEASLSRLCAWVVQADQLGLVYGLRLPKLEIAPASGEAHRTHCLQALAAY
jgi:uncharacterized protein (DUF58 family)